VKDDIVVYLKDKLPKLRDEPQLTNLAEKADGLFIYAATVVRHITPRPKMAKLEQLRLMRMLLDGTWSMSASAHTEASLVDELYRQILRAAFFGLDDKQLHDRRSILHTFLCTQERVSPSVAATLLFDNGMEEIVRIIVEELHAVKMVTSSGTMRRSRTSSSLSRDQILSACFATWLPTTRLSPAAASGS
jgi:hypothetical protein